MRLRRLGGGFLLAALMGLALTGCPKETPPDINTKIDKPGGDNKMAPPGDSGGKKYGSR